MTVAIEKQTKVLAKMREQFRRVLHQYDAAMRRQRTITLLLQIVQLVAVASLPLVVFWLRESASLLVAVSAMSVLALALGMYQFALNPQVRWVQYVFMRNQLQKRVLELDVAVQSEQGLTEDQLHAYSEQLSKLLVAEQSLWDLGDLRPMDVESLGERK